MDNRNSRYQNRGPQPQRYNKPRDFTPRFFELGSKVFINAFSQTNQRIVYMCEARVIRQPLYAGAPYKLLITGVRTNSDKRLDAAAKKLLSLKLLRRQDNVFSSKAGHWTRQETDSWVRLEDDRANSLVNTAIKNIKKDSARRSSHR